MSPDSLHARAFRDSPVAMAIEDDRHLLVEVNRAFCQALRASEEDLLDVDLALLIPAATWTIAVGGRFETIDGSADDPQLAKVHLVHRGDGTVGRVWLSKSVSTRHDGGRWVLWSLVELPELSSASDDAGPAMSLQQSDLMDAIRDPVVTLNHDRTIVAMSAGFREAMGSVARTGCSLASLGGDAWHRLDDELAGLAPASGPAHWTLDLPWREGRPARLRVEAHRLASRDGGSRIVLGMTDAAPMDAASRQQWADRAQAAQSETYRSVVDNLVALAGLLTVHVTRDPDLARQRLNVAAQLMALSAIFELQALRPGHLSLETVVRSVVSHRAHLHGVDIPFSSPRQAPSAGAGQGACLRERDAMLVALAIDELIGNALAHGPSGTTPATRLFETAEYAVFHVRNAIGTPVPLAPDDIEPDTSGLGLVKAILPPGARLMIVQAGGFLIASVLLQAPLLRIG